MTQTHPEDSLALVSTAPEHCLDCFRLVRPGETYHQGADNTVLCPTCHGSLLIGEDFQTVATASGLAVEYGGGLIRIRREGASIVVPALLLVAGLLRPQAVRHW